MKDARQPFKVGQVVVVHDPFEFGEITQILDGDEVEITFWDFDRSDRWSWMYPTKDIKPLTMAQCGRVR